MEWLARERTGAEDRVWCFGFVYHPNHGDGYNDELSEFLDWLDTNFVGQESPYGSIIARYATVSEIAGEFYEWEEAHPGVSSFNYMEGDPYPYTFAAFAERLTDADYEASLDLVQRVRAFRFSRQGDAFYLIWVDKGEQIIDFSGELTGQVRITDAAGQEKIQDSGSLPLTEVPILIEVSP